MIEEIYNKLSEAFDPEKDLPAPTMEEVVKRRLSQSQCTQNEDGTYSCKGDVDLSELGLTKLPVKFREVGGDFNCSNNQLTTLQGSPQKVGGGFSCSNNQLTTLQDAPQKVGGDFYCSNNPVSVKELKATLKASVKKSKGK